MKTLETPYYLIDERKLLKNLKIIKRIKDVSGTKVVLALKCFSLPAVFGLVKKYMDGTTASSPYEARLGHDRFGKETHVYSVGYSLKDVKEVSRFSDKIIFNSISQLKKFSRYAGPCQVGLRVNPGVSYSHFDLADPAREFSRLGVVDKKALSRIAGSVRGVMFHFNCENDDFKSFCGHLDHIGRTYGKILKKIEWVSLGGGLYFTKKGYPVEKFAKKIKSFSDEFNVQVYLEPGESVITGTGQLVAKVLDIVHNGIDIAIVDASAEAHMLDLLVYRSEAKMEHCGGRFTYMIAGRSCLAGDVFGTYRFKRRLKVGSIIRFADAAGYTMVKKNWFNGLKMPSIAVKRINGSIDLVRQFSYKDFIGNLS